MTRPSELQSLIGHEVGVSKWFEVDQARIDAFAKITEDEQFIHVDPEAAKATPFGGTIAHGFLTLSLLSALAIEAMPVPEGAAMGVNYGFDKVRFLSPVPAGGRIRGRFRLLEATERKPGEWLIRFECTVELEGAEKPAIIAEWLNLMFAGQSGQSA